MNKFRQAPPPSPLKSTHKLDSGLEGGIDLDKSTQDLQLFQSPDQDKVRIRKGALRQDYGLTQLASAPGNKIIAVGEHRFVLSASTLNSKVFRVYRDGSNHAQLDTLTGTTWASEATGSFTIQEVLLGWESYFDAVFFADGAKVFKWDRSPAIVAQKDDFGAANALTSEGATTIATIAPGAAWDDKYKANYKVNLVGPNLDAGTILVELLKGTTILASKTYLVPATNSTSRALDFNTEVFEFIDTAIPNGTVLTLRLTTRSGSPIINIDALANAGGTPDWSGNKSRTREAKGQFYKFIFSINDDGIGGYANVEFYYKIGAGSWTIIETVPFPTGYFHEYTVYIPGLVASSQFGINLQAGTPVEWLIIDGRVEWEEVYDVTVHGFKESEDTTPGITYDTFGAAVNAITQVSDEASTALNARYVGKFGERIWLLRSSGDPQKLQYCVDGNTKKWLADGANEVFLSGKGDPIDELMAGPVEIGPNIGALFRARSIMRVVPTGDIDPEFVFSPWITKVGTESPFSVKQTPFGIMFLGSDRQVYLLSETALTPLGFNWNEDLDLSTLNLASIQGYYDEVLSSYKLSVITSEV